jgi:type II secretory pathway pseudopilin PulG
MFGGGKFGIGQAIVAALNGYLAGRGNPVGLQNMQMIQQAQEMKRREALAEQQRQQQLQDQMTMHQQTRNYDIAHRMPGEFEEALTASGIQPGTPEWTKAMQQRVGNILDPVVMTPYGPMLRSQVVGTQQPQILQSLPPGAKPIGGAGPSQAPQPFPGY